MIRKLSKIALAGSLVLLSTAGTALAEEEAPQNEKAQAILAAFELPEAAQELRAAGVVEEQLSRALEALKSAPADEAEGTAAQRAARVLRAEAETAREEGPLENFGEFVREEVEKGTRGQELAQAIRERREGRMPAAAQERREAAQERQQEGAERREAAQEGQEAGAAQRGAAQQRQPAGRQAGDDNADSVQEAVERKEAAQQRQEAGQQRGAAERGRPSGN